MIKIIQEETRLLLKYVPDFRRVEATWVDENLKNNGAVRIARVFTFLPEHIASEPKEPFDESKSREFILGELDQGYYKINKNILGLQFDLLLVNAMMINNKTFIATENISVFRRIDDLVKEQIVIGGDRENAIPVADFEKLLQIFPTNTTLKHFARSRISGILKEYLGTITDAEKNLNDHLKKQRPIKSYDKLIVLQEYEVRKYEFIRDRLIEMLKDSDIYSENKWQKLIVDFLLLIFPKYVAVLETLHIKDFYTKVGKPTDRYIDLTLVDANGNIDIIEIKKPFTNSLLSTSKYRDNYTPKKELSGSVMQVEKYLFHLNKWGAEGEQQINARRASELPNGMRIRVTNPKAMIILGRDNDFETDQKFDFEIIKRKYANIVDIMTYDDLLQRLENIIAKFKTLPLL